MAKKQSSKPTDEAAPAAEEKKPTEAAGEPKKAKAPKAPKAPKEPKDKASPAAPAADAPAVRVPAAEVSPTAPAATQAPTGTKKKGKQPGRPPRRGKKLRNQLQT